MKAQEDAATPNVIDLARVREAHARLRPSVAPAGEHVAAAVFEAMPGSLAVLGVDGTILATNSAWLEGAPMCDVGADFFRDWAWAELDPMDAAAIISGVRAAVTGSSSLTHDCTIAEQRVVFVATALAGGRGGAVVTITSPTDQLDPVTGLSTRARFVRRLESELARPDDLTVSLLAIKLLGFKLVNQTYGHRVGDDLLRSVGERLVSVVDGPTDVTHLGGTEFALLARNRSARLATSITDRLTEPFVLASHEIHLGARVGCRLARANEGEDAEAVLTDAVAAMSDAKDRSNDGVAFFTQQTRDVIDREALIERELHRALEHDELSVAFQPLVDQRTGEPYSVEALSRWEHAELGTIAPTEFIPIAESTGLVRALGDWILEQSCRELARWHRIEPTAPRSVSVNVSVLQLTDPRLTLRIGEALERHGLAPRHLKIEITETALLASQEHGIDALHELHDLGVWVGLDDFGTGHSSLARLQALPVDYLKLDRSFVIALESAQGRSIAAAIMDLANALRLATVAEGVETLDQANHLRQLGCNVLQGWLYARAVPADDLLNLCRAGFPALPMPQVESSGADERPGTLR